MNIPEEEWNKIKEASERTGTTVCGLIRMLIRGYRPKEKPDDRFYEAMEQMSGIADNISKLADRVRSFGHIDAAELEKEVVRWHRFQLGIEKQFLKPEVDRKIWR